MQSRPIRLAPLAALLLTVPSFAQEQEGVDPKTRVKQLQQQKERLEQEIEYTRSRVANASEQLAQKLQRGAPQFRVIDAGQVPSPLPITTAPIQFKYAQIGSAEQMNLGGEQQLVMVAGRGISQAAFDNVLTHVRTTQPQGSDVLLAQRVFYDMIRIEAIAGAFEESEGEVTFSENLAALQDGSLAFDAAAKRFGTVQGADESGTITLTCPSIYGPSFEYVAFTTADGSVSRPFRTTSGLAVLKVLEKNKDETSGRPTIRCQVVEFPYTSDKAALQNAQRSINTGQVQVYARDAEVMNMLPALFKRPAPRPSPMEQLTARLGQLRQRLTAMKADSNSDPDAIAKIEKQIANVEAQLKNTKAPQDAAQEEKSDADAAGKIDAKVEQQPAKQQPVVPKRGNGGGDE